jgi:hypothetical protein
VLERPLRYIAVLASAIVLVSFALFAIDETQSASVESRAAIAAQDVSSRDPGAAAAVERLREHKHSALREHIDDANDVLTRPFSGIVHSSSSIWMRRAVPSVLALLLFGVGFAFLARFSKGSSRPRRHGTPDAPHVAGRV